MKVILIGHWGCGTKAQRESPILLTYLLTYLYTDAFTLNVNSRRPAVRLSMFALRQWRITDYDFYIAFHALQRSVVRRQRSIEPRSQCAVHKAARFISRHNVSVASNSRRDDKLRETKKVVDWCKLIDCRRCINDRSQSAASLFVAFRCFSDKSVSARLLWRRLVQTGLF